MAVPIKKYPEQQGKSHTCYIPTIAYLIMVQCHWCIKKLINNIIDLQGFSLPIAQPRDDDEEVSVEKEHEFWCVIYMQLYTQHRNVPHVIFPTTLVWVLFGTAIQFYANLFTLVTIISFFW